MKVAFKLQEFDGAVEARTAVQEDTAMDPEEFRTKKRASAMEADTTTQPDDATEAATADVPEDVRAEKEQSTKLIMKETQVKEPLNSQPEAEGAVTVKAEVKINKKKLQAQFKNQSTIKAKNRGLDLPEGSNVADPAFEDAGKLESESDDSSNKLNYEGAEEGGSVQDIAGGLDMMLNAKVGTRQKPVNNVIKFVTAVGCGDVEKELMNLIEEDSVHTEGDPKMKWENCSPVSSNWDLAGVLTRRAYHPEPCQRSLLQNDSKSLFPLRSVLPIPEVSFPDLMKSRGDQFKAAKKKARNKTGQVDLKEKWMGIGTTRLYLGGISAVGRTKVDKNITAQGHTEVLMVLFHLEQTVSLHDEQVKELVPLEIDERNLSYDGHQEVVAEDMTKRVQNQKKTRGKSRVEQVLSMNETVYQKAIDKEANSKNDGTPLCTPLANTSLKPDGTPIGTADIKFEGTPNSKSVGTPMCTPNGTSNSKSDGTPMCTPMNTISFKSKGTPLGKPLCTPMCTQFGTPMGPLISTPKKQVEFSSDDLEQVRSRLQLSTILLSKWHTKTEIVHQDEGTGSKLKMIKSEDVYPDKIGSMENVQVQAKPNQDVSSMSKFSMSLTFHENVGDDDEEDVTKDEEVKNDDDDVCDSMTKEVGSSYNSPDVNMHDKVKTLVEGEVDEEPGGNVSARSRSLRFRQSKA